MAVAITTVIIHTYYQKATQHLYFCLFLPYILLSAITAIQLQNIQKLHLKYSTISLLENNPLTMSWCFFLSTNCAVDTVSNAAAANVKGMNVKLFDLDDMHYSIADREHFIS